MTHSEIVNGAAKRIADLEGMVRRMILEGLGVAEQHEAQGEPFWHLFRMSEYRAPNSDEKVTGYIAHQDTNWLSIVCQNEVNGNEMQTRDGEWVLVKPSPTSLIVNVGNALRAWTNDRLHAPFHRIMVPDELVDECHPPRFKTHDNDDFIRFCVSEEGARHEDKLKAFCGL
uniref:Isopenicillin N synthase-like Fe(2+) 2OG dioxygenase domain-containing protein n=1 Tax=Oryza meridionalis TaxID=40149 RepID=A0A0E0DUR3_9ORYZ